MLFEQTQEDSLTDPLTGLPNTRFMFMHLTRELARAERLKSEVSLLVMDLDNFKDINDTHGHHVGDRALREVARVLRAAIRPYDICVRYAGDEFIVVLSGCGADEAEQQASGAAARHRRTLLRGPAGQAGALGISVGAAVFPHDGESYEALLAAADSRMYQDKATAKARRRAATPHHPHRVAVPGPDRRRYPAGGDWGSSEVLRGSAGFCSVLLGSPFLEPNAAVLDAQGLEHWRHVSHHGGRPAHEAQSFGMVQQPCELRRRDAAAIASPSRRHFARVAARSSTSPPGPSRAVRRDRRNRLGCGRCKEGGTFP